MSDNSDFVPQTTYRRIDEIVPLDSVLPPVHNASEYANIDFIMVDFQKVASDKKYWKDGTPTYYYMLECLDDKSGETFMITCGGYLVARQLEALNKADDLPLKCTFKKHTDGKTWRLA
jgi:hypothetical protein